MDAALKNVIQKLQAFFKSLYLALGEKEMSRKITKIATRFESWWRLTHPGEEPYCVHLQHLFAALEKGRERGEKLVQLKRKKERQNGRRT